MVSQGSVTIRALVRRPRCPRPSGEPMRLANLPFALLAALVAAPAAQVPPARVAPPHVTVTVVDASDAPIADATVTLYGPTLQNGSLSMRTDDHGTFSFRWLAPGGYRIGATKDGFLPVQEGQRNYRHAGRRFTLQAGEQRDVRLRLPRLGVVARSPRGRPQNGQKRLPAGVAEPQAGQRTPAILGGAWRLNRAPLNPTHLCRLDDRARCWLSTQEISYGGALTATHRGSALCHACCSQSPP